MVMWPGFELGSLRNQLPSTLNARSQTDWTIEDEIKKNPEHLYTW